MSKMMSLEDLSSIKGATSSAAIEELFNNIKKAAAYVEKNHTLLNISSNNTNVEVNQLREDVVINSSETERNIIKQNFPKEKNGYLVVSKVIEN